MIQYQHDSPSKACRAFLPRSTLAVRAGQLSAVCDEPGSVLLNNRSKIVAHMIILVRHRIGSAGPTLNATGPSNPPGGRHGKTSSQRRTIMTAAGHMGIHFTQQTQAPGLKLFNRRRNS